MRATNLVLFEGIPGSGKSSSAHAVQRQLAAQGTPHRWWYEGEKGHPLYTFDDWKSMDRMIGDVCSGDVARVGRVVQETLHQWRGLAVRLAAGEEVLLFDGMLYGHLGWTMFAGDVPPETIAAYVATAEAEVARVGACLVYFRPDDVRAAIMRITARRGEAWGKNFEQRVGRFPYCLHRGMEGFDGLVGFWQDFRTLTDELFDQSALTKLRITNDAGDWAAYLREVRALLNLPEPVPDHDDPPGATAGTLERFAGTYTCVEGDKTQTATVTLDQGELFVSGVPHIWRHTRLIPTAGSANRLAAESLPFCLVFVEDSSATIQEMLVDGPDFVERPILRRFVKQR